MARELQTDFGTALSSTPMRRGYQGGLKYCRATWKHPLSATTRRHLILAHKYRHRDWDKVLFGDKSGVFSG